MRTTVRVEDALLLELKRRAAKESISLTRLFNRTLRAGLRAEKQETKPKRPYREKVHSMGQPRGDLTKALAMASSLEDDETLRKARLRK
jgi:hypothetical protein